MNRTGIGTSPRHGKDMMEGAARGPVTPGKPEDAHAMRQDYIEGAAPLGTIPPPGTVKGVVKSVKKKLKGAGPAAFSDKLAERLAFERTGTRLYEALLVKFQALGSFPGGPTEAELRRFHAEEARHFAMLRQAIEGLGADPTAMTPSADIVAVESAGIGQVLHDPRTTLAQCLHAILLAELADRDGWDLLIELADGIGQTELASRFRTALAEEEEHLRSVRAWVGAHCRAEAGAGRAAA